AVQARELRDPVAIAVLMERLDDADHPPCSLRSTADRRRTASASLTSSRTTATAGRTPVTAPTDSPAYSAAEATSPSKARVGGSGERSPGSSVDAATHWRRTRCGACGQPI